MNRNISSYRGYVEWTLRWDEVRGLERATEILSLSNDLFGGAKIFSSLAAEQVRDSFGGIAESLW